MAATLDLNLLRALDALLSTSSVTEAALMVRISIPAMSRTLSRLRHALGDPLLVRAGRRMVVTPFAAALRERVRAAHAETRAVLEPSRERSVASVERDLVIRASDAVVASLAGPLLAAGRSEAPGLRLRFLPEGDEDADALRDGTVMLDIGVVELVEPELRKGVLVRDVFCATVRKNHPLAGMVAVSSQDLVRFPHCGVSRKGKADGPLDRLLARARLRRDVAVVVPSFLAALVVASDTDTLAVVPRIVANRLGPSLGVVALALPDGLPSIEIAQVWHPRFDRDPAHMWLRQTVKRIARSTLVVIE